MSYIFHCDLILSSALICFRWSRQKNNGDKWDSFCCPSFSLYICIFLSRTHSIISISSGKVNLHHPVKLFKGHNEDKTALVWKYIPIYCARLLPVWASPSITNTDVRGRGHFRKKPERGYLYSGHGPHSSNYEPLNFSASQWSAALVPGISKGFQITRVFPRGGPISPGRPPAQIIAGGRSFTITGMTPTWWIQAAAEHHQQHWSAHNYRKRASSRLLTAFIWQLPKVQSESLPGCPSSCHGNQ